jgi:hypothetical protein
MFTKHFFSNVTNYKQGKVVKFVSDRLRGKTFVKKRTYLHNLQQQTGLIRFCQGKLEHYLVILIKVLIEKFSKAACYPKT